MEVIIGERTFKFKKDALNHYKAILNSYDYGESLTPKDFVDVLSLLQLHDRFDEKKILAIKEIKVDRIKTKNFNTKCFYAVQDNQSPEAFSYLRCINGRHSLRAKFNKACRNAVSGDLRDVKLQYFKENSKKGRVKCQETGVLCTWEELSVDHRQPNTFSVIVDRFIELFDIDVSLVKYDEAIDSVLEFQAPELVEKVRLYHREKANLRIVRKELNLGRSHQARTKTQKKDLRIGRKD